MKQLYNSFISSFKNISKDEKFTLLFTFFANLCIHMFAYTNTLFTYDSVQIYNDSSGIDNGRFMVSILMPLFGRMQIPWLSGLLFSATMALSVLLITKIFNITKKFYIALTALLTASFPVVFMSHAFMSSLYIYGIAILFAVLAVWLFTKDKPIFYVLGCVFFIMCLGCYQAYISFAVSLFLVYLLKELADGKQAKYCFKKLLLCGILFVLSTAAYYAIWQGLMHIFDVSAINYRGENAGFISTIGAIPKNIITTYVLGFVLLFNKYIYAPDIPFLLTGCLAIVNLFAVVKSLKHKQFSNIMLSCVIVAGSPLAIGLIFLLSPVPPHGLMTMSAIVYFYLAIHFLNTNDAVKNDKPTKPSVHKISACINYLVSFILIVIITSNTVIGNGSYIKMHSDYERAASIATRIVDRIECQPGVTAGTKVMIIAGDNTWFAADEETFSSDPSKMEILKKSNTQIVKDTREWKYRFKNFTNISNTTGVPYADALVWFINDNNNYLGLNYSVASTNDDFGENTDKVLALEPFPSNNCIAWINDTLVVRV